MASKEGTARPTISAAPSVGQVGSVTFVSGAGFQPEEQLELFISQEKVDTKFFRSEDGEYVTWIRTPNLSQGSYTLRVQSSSGKSATLVYTVVPAINLTPTIGWRGVPLMLSGSGFASESPIIVCFAGVVLPLGPGVMTAKNGGFSTSIIVPRKGVPGIYTISASDERGNSASATFTISSPIISVSPTTGRTGASVRVVGARFNPESMLRISLSGRQIMTISAPRITSQGAFVASITVPQDVVIGYQIITVSDEDGNTALATFQVTA